MPIAVVASTNVLLPLKLECSEPMLDTVERPEKSKCALLMDCTNFGQHSGLEPHGSQASSALHHHLTSISVQIHVPSQGPLSCVKSSRSVLRV